MRVVLVELAPAGGLFQFSLQMGDALAGAGCEVEIVTGRDPELAPREPGCSLVPILPTWWPRGTEGASRPVYLARRAWRALRYVLAWFVVSAYLVRRPPDVVQWSEFRFWFEGAFVAVLASLLRRRGTRMAVVAHTPVPRRMGTAKGSDEVDGLLITKAFKAAYRRVDCVFVLGERARERFMEAWPDTPRVEVIPHGTEDVYDADHVPAADSTGPTALFFGNWDRYKGVDLLLDAWPRVRAREPEARLTLAGSIGADVDGPALVARAEALDGVTAIPHYVEHNAVAPLFAAARCVVLPYVRVYQSGVAHLAANFARPVVATDVGDLRSVIVDGETGILVPPADAEELARGLCRLLADAEEAGRLGRGARERVSRESDWSEIARAVCTTYSSLAGGEVA